MLADFIPVGRDPEHALRMVNPETGALAYISAGGDLTTKNPAHKPPGDLVREAAKNAEENQQTVKGSKAEVKNASPAGKSPENRNKVCSAITEYLEDCLDRPGKFGYGLASRTHETYTYRLGFLEVRDLKSRSH